MKILHTSDWHLGKTLYSKKDREDEHLAFLEWLIKTIKESSIDLLLITGDIFDTATPSSTTQKIYFDFLLKVRTVGCKNVIIIGGNHDSPSFLNAPKKILEAFNVLVIGNATSNIEDEIIVIRDDGGNPKIIVCAVPFLRERDISSFVEGENYSDRSKRINENIKKHYHKIALLAENKRIELGKEIPIIATGHLSVLGGQRIEDDGVREIYIGNIEAIDSDIFPDIFDYVALGHYHIPSIIKEHIRYCGSPIPIGFGEAKQSKCVYVIDFSNGKKIETISIPVFQKLESIIGNKNFIETRLNELKKAGESIWVEVIYNGDEIFPDFSSWLDEQVIDSNIEVLKLQNRQNMKDVLSTSDTMNLLEEISVFDVFNKLLEKEKISDEQKDELIKYYKEIVDSLNITEKGIL